MSRNRLTFRSVARSAAQDSRTLLAKDENTCNFNADNHSTQSRTGTYPNESS